ncbi:MAG TPA: putative inorganic carbon transporter subunit DabA, partial [Nannocystis sp.]
MSKTAASAPPNPRVRLRKTLERIAHYLPAQGPLEVFVHHNTLHAYQHLPFHEAIAAAQAQLGVHGYLPEEKYREALATGRIAATDLEAVIAEATFATTRVAPGFPPERTVARLVVLHSIAAESPASLHWQIVEKQANSQFAADVPVAARRAIVTATDMWLAPRMAGQAEVDDGHSKLFRLADKSLSADEEVARLIVGQPEFLSPAAELAALLGARARPEAFMARHEAVALRSLWTACVDACRHLEGTVRREDDAPLLPREALLSVSDEDADDLVHATLVPLCAAFLDRGQSHWSMPDRELGFFRAWLGVMLTGRSVRPGWLSELGPRLAKYQERRVEGEDVVLELFAELGIPEAEQERFIERTLLRLPGFAGMFARLETAPGPIGRSRARVNLIDFLAVRLLLDLFAFQDIARRLGHHGPVAEIRRFCAHLPRIAPPRMRGPHDTAWPLFMLAQHAGVAAPTIRQAQREHIDAVIALLDRLDDHARLILWHEAYERRYRNQLLDAVAANIHGEELPPAPAAPPRFQAMFCIDDRFESSRRH